MKKILLMIVVCLLLTGCGVEGSRAKTLFDAEDVKITTQGHTIAVCDLEGGAAYKFTPRLVKRSEAATAPRTMVQTNTIKIINRPGGGLVVVTNKNTYEIRRKLWINL